MARKPNNRSGNPKKKAKLKDQVSPQSVEPSRRFLIPTSAIDTVATYITLAFGGAAAIAQQLGHTTVALWLFFLTVCLAAFALIAHAYEKHWWPWHSRGQGDATEGPANTLVPVPAHLPAKTTNATAIIRAAHYLPNPTPQHIAKILDNSPPLAREAVSQQFLGAPVSWDGRLTMCSHHTDGTKSLHMSYGLPNDDDDGGEWKRSMSIVFELEFPKHNFLLQMNEGAPLHVDGIIKNFSGWNMIELGDIHLRALDVA